MMHFMLVFSRQGNIRLERWWDAQVPKSGLDLAEFGKAAAKRELVQQVLARKRGDCNFIEWQGLLLVYRRYASLVFCCGIDPEDNELLALELIHRFVELLDRYFDNVCELDILFNFDKAYMLLDELFVAGEMQETSIHNVLWNVNEMERKMEQCSATKKT